jgi:large subunit ribosomal protein L21
VPLLAIQGGRQMYAVIELGGKQQLVKKGDVIEVEKLEIDDGKDMTVENVLLVCDGDKVEIGQPFVKGAQVVVTIIQQTKADKTIAFKYRRRKASHTKKGHRQKLTEIKIKDITL